MKLVKLLGGSLAACAMVSTAHAGLTDWQGHDGWQKGDVAGFDDAYVYVPAKTAPRSSDGSTDKRSLVIHLIGCGQTADQAAASAGWEMAADEYGMIVVIPNPMDPAHPNKAATNVACFNYGNDDNDYKNNRDAAEIAAYADHKAIIAAPAKLKAIYPEIDEKQVYVTGLSAGASVAMEVACMAPDVFAGVGEAAGPAWSSRQQQAVAAVGGSGDNGNTTGVQTTPSTMKDYCEEWAGSKVNGLKDQIWAIVSDDNFLPIGGLDLTSNPYTFKIFAMGDVWDGDKFTPTVYHEYVTEVMQDLILDGKGTKSEEVITSSAEHGQGSGCSLAAANYEWNGYEDGGQYFWPKKDEVDYSDVQCLPKDYIRRDWEAKAEIWKDTEGYKKLVRIQQDTLKHSWPIGSENKTKWVTDCVGAGGITVNQIYNPEDPNYSDLKDSDGMWNVDKVEGLPNGAIGCIYHNPVSINFPMYLGKLWNNNNPALGDPIDDNEEPKDSDSDGVVDGQDNCPVNANPDQKDTDKDGIGDVCDDLTDSDNDGVADEDDNCPSVANPGQEDTDGNGIGDVCDDPADSDNDGVADEDDNCPLVANPGQEDADGNGIGDACEETDGLDIKEVQVEVMAESHMVVVYAAVQQGDAELDSVSAVLYNSFDMKLGTFEFDYSQSKGKYVLRLGNLTDGTYTLKVTAKDTDGNVDSEETGFTMGDDVNTPPQISGFTGAQDGTDCVVFSGKATDANGTVESVTVRVTGVGDQDVTVSGDSFSSKVCGLGAGTYNAAAVATDNEGAASVKTYAVGTIKASEDNVEPEEYTGIFSAHQAAGRITGSYLAPTEQYTELKDKYCADAWFGLPMFCYTQITLRKCPADDEWTDAEVTCGGQGVADKKADIAVASADLGTINTDTVFVLESTVTNNGPDTANAVSLNVTVPAGIDVNMAGVEADCVTAAGIIECALGSIASGDSKTVAIPATSAVEGGYSIAVMSASAQKDEDAGNNAGIISVVIGKVVPDEEAPVISSISLTPASEVEEGKSVTVTVVASDNKGVTSGSVSNVAGGKLCTLALKSGTATDGTFECSFVAPDVEADTMLSVDATVADAAGNSADSELAQITVKFVDQSWVAPEAYSDLNGTKNPEWYTADKNYSNYNDYYEANKDKNLSDLNMYLHVPAGLEKDPAIVIAMHGCNQAGYQTNYSSHAKAYNTDTEWTEFADKHKFIVIFPEVVFRKTMVDFINTDAKLKDGDNKFRINGDFSCFAWAGFYGLGLNRDEGDAKTIMNMVDWVKAKYSLTDNSKVYATGFSAGGGMAAALAAIYPDKIEGVSINAGLPAFVATANVPADSIEVHETGAPKNPGETHPIVKEIQYTMGSDTGFNPNQTGCNKSESGEGCMHKDYYARTAQELGDYVRDYGYRPNNQDYTGTYPKVIAFQGMSDQFVDDRNAELIARQWTNIHGIDMITDGDDSINGTSKHTYKEYQNDAGEALVATVEVPSMCHAVVIDDGTAENQGGKQTQSLGSCSQMSKYSTDADVYHVYYSAKFWGLID